jgi:hypothetical protein
LIQRAFPFLALALADFNSAAAGCDL